MRDLKHPCQSACLVPIPRAAPKILRDVESPSHGFPLRGPDDFLRKGDGRSLLGRNRLRELLKEYPVNRCVLRF